jgi:hypothetical protein
MPTSCGSCESCDHIASQGCNEAEALGDALGSQVCFELRLRWTARSCSPFTPFVPGRSGRLAAAPHLHHLHYLRQAGVDGPQLLPSSFSVSRSGCTQQIYMDRDITCDWVLDDKVMVSVHSCICASQSVCLPVHRLVHCPVENRQRRRRSDVRESGTAVAMSTGWFMFAVVCVKGLGRNSSGVHSFSLARTLGLHQLAVHAVVGPSVLRA